ncbi:hypothetical protein HJC23_009433 [Cyclotella cryptica]|uniref:Uncharacterized protein n=1 Tax=Cyclotella cryptica TaxID=29204 RepID=A0ABD3Q6Y2_9STRA
MSTTHRNELPYTSSTRPDVWDALINVDTDSTGQNVHLIYSNKYVPALPHDSGTCGYWNQEHLWPQSQGVSNSGMDNTDLHHLRPVNCNVNSAHVEKRGDIARAIFYMDLRYSGSEQNTLDLVVSDCPSSVPNGAGMGYLSQLLQRHLDDPVHQEEIDRNENVCSN